MERFDDSGNDRTCPFPPRTRRCVEVRSDAEHYSLGGTLTNDACE